MVAHCGLVSWRRRGNDSREAGSGAIALPRFLNISPNRRTLP